MPKNSLNHLSVIAKHRIACVQYILIKCKLQDLKHNFNILKVNVMYICCRDVKKIVNSFQYKCEVLSYIYSKKS